VLEQLTILAPGLLGASVARAARARGLARRIVLWSRRPETRLQLRAQDFCDAVVDTPEEAVREASLVVLAPPVDRIAALAEQIAPALPAGALVTDVGSVKGDIARLGHGALRADTHFVPAHPMAGSDKNGWEHSTATLFENRVCFITPLPESNAGAVEAVAAFWQDLGMQVVSTSPDTHDEIVAHISHLPQILASTLCQFLDTKDHSWRNYAGGGLRDTTRIAGSDPVIWRAIIEHNRDEILRALHQYQDELQAFASALANRDYLEVQARLERARSYRGGLRVP
jgi:prephenate dehydrogenase